jgi:hypothetical protein
MPVIRHFANKRAVDCGPLHAPYPLPSGRKRSSTLFRHGVISGALLKLFNREPINHYLFRQDNFDACSLGPADSVAIPTEPQNAVPRDESR